MLLMVTQHPRFNNLDCEIVSKNSIYLHAEEQVKEVFTPASIVLFLSGFGLRNHLLWAKVYPLLEDKESSCCGKSRCETCFNIKEINVFVTFEKNVLLRFVIKNIYKSNHQNHFDSKCFIYLLYCKVCGLQCFRSTFDKFCCWWNN